MILSFIRAHPPLQSCLRGEPLICKEKGSFLKQSKSIKHSLSQRICCTKVELAFAAESLLRYKVTLSPFISVKCNSFFHLKRLELLKGIDLSFRRTQEQSEWCPHLSLSVSFKVRTKVEKLYWHDWN